MAEESKQVDPAKGDATEVPDTTSRTTEADVESGDDSGSEAEADAAVAQGPAEGEGAKKKKKKSKKSKAKQALAQVLGGNAGEAQAVSNPKKAIEGLTEQQIAEFVALNPALANDLGASSRDPAAMAQAFKRLKLQDIMIGLASSGKNKKDMASYKFWATQPVPRLGEGTDGPIQEGPIKVQEVKDVSTERVPLALEQFRWVTMDLTNDEEMSEVEKILYVHYVEDDEAMFRFK